MNASAQATVKVSVLIANYNGESLLHDCLRSVLEQSGASDIEIIVHDDASTDASLALLKHHYPTVKVISSDRNVGFCVANNRMAAVANGRYLLLLNNDAALFADAVETMLHAAGAARPTSIIATVPQYDWETGELVDQGCHLDPFYNPVPIRSSKPCSAAMVIGACLFVERDLWIRAGGFPEWFGSIAEDMLLCCTARLQGAEVISCSNSGYRHRQGASFGGSRVSRGKLASNLQRRRLSEHNKTMVMLICTPGVALVLLLPLHLLLLLFEGVVLTTAAGSLRPLKAIYLHTLYSVWSDRQRWVAERQRVAGTRKLGAIRYFSRFRLFPRKLQMLVKHGFPSLTMGSERTQKQK